MDPRSFCVNGVFANMAFRCLLSVWGRFVSGPVSVVKLKTRHTLTPARPANATKRSQAKDKVSKYSMILTFNEN